MKKLFYFLLFILFLISNSIKIHAQTLEETLSKISGEASKAYVLPIGSAFGSNLNSGWVRKAPSATKLSLDVDISFVAMATFFSDEGKTFSSSGDFRFSKAQAEQIVPSNITGATRQNIINEIISKYFNVSISGPTIVGSKNDSVKVVFPGQVIQGQNIGSKTIVLPVGGFLEDLPALPLFAPQVTVGTVYGTSVSLRILPEIEINKDLGKFKFSGFGIQHNPLVWFPFDLPLNVSLGYFTQSMEVGTIFKSSSSIFGVYASKRFGPGGLSIEPYGGISFESSKMEVGYDVVFDSPAGPQPSRISYELEGENSARFTLGTNINLGPIRVSVDYNMAKYSAISGAFSFGF